MTEVFSTAIVFLPSSEGLSVQVSGSSVINLGGALVSLVGVSNADSITSPSCFASLLLPLLPTCLLQP